MRRGRQFDSTGQSSQNPHSSHTIYSGLVGRHPTMQHLYRLIEQVAPVDTPVLISGETGTGKELVARAIHARSRRVSESFIAVNCVALTDALLESELFGHRKGAFTGAIEEKPGLFELADRGTIFLDEIGEMDPRMQVKLLRVIQNGELRRVGETRNRQVDVRIIAATNRDLAQALAQGTFRQDLYYRLSVFPLPLPPVRARREDIPLLAAHGLDRANTKLGRCVGGFTPEALAALMTYAWPGNVRELEHEIERAVLLTQHGDWIPLEVLSIHLHPKNQTVSFPVESRQRSLKEHLEDVERQFIEEALRHYHENRTQAAHHLGLTRWSLLRKMVRLGIEREGGVSACDTSGSPIGTRGETHRTDALPRNERSVSQIVRDEP